MTGGCNIHMRKIYPQNIFWLLNIFTKPMLKWHKQDLEFHPDRYRYATCSAQKWGGQREYFCSDTENILNERIELCNNQKTKQSHGIMREKSHLVFDFWLINTDCGFWWMRGGSHVTALIEYSQITHTFFDFSFEGLYY